MAPILEYLYLKENTLIVALRLKEVKVVIYSSVPNRRQDAFFENRSRGNFSNSTISKLYRNENKVTCSMENMNIKFKWDW